MLVFQVQHASGLFRTLWAWRLLVETNSWTFYQPFIDICGGKLATSCYSHFTGSPNKSSLRMGRPQLKISVTVPFLGSDCIRVRLQFLLPSFEFYIQSTFTASSLCALQPPRPQSKTVTIA